MAAPEDDRRGTMNAYAERRETVRWHFGREDALGEIAHGKAFRKRRGTLAETNSETGNFALLLFVEVIDDIGSRR